MSSLYDPVSGEVTQDQDAIRDAALEYVFLDTEIKERDDEQAAARKRLGEMGADLRMALGQFGTVDVGPAVVVVAPAPRPAQRVSRSGCEAYQEELHGLGLGRYVYQPPGISEIRRNAARIIAADIELERIAPTPAPGPDTLKIVFKDEAA